MKKTTRQLLLVLIAVILVMSPAMYAQNKIAKLSNAEYSQMMLQKLQALNIKQALYKSGSLNRLKRNKTMLLVEAKRHFDRLTPEAQTAFKKVMARPTGFTKTYDETTKNFFRFYYTTTGADSVASADANSNGTPDYVENMAQAFVKALNTYDSLGYNRPPIASSDSGKYCVYISSSSAGDYVYGYSEPETDIGDNPATALVETQSVTSFMVMRSEYADFGTTAAELQIAMEVTAGHEFFHAIQFGYEYDNMSPYFMEMCATWGEDITFPGDDDNWQYLTSIFDTPDVSLDFDDYYDDANGTSNYSGHCYSAWIFMRYLTDQYGADVVKAAYEGTIAHYDAIALDNVLQSKSTTLHEAIKNFDVAIALLTSSTTAPMSQYRFQRGDDYRTLTKNSGGSATGPFVINYEGAITYSGSKVSYSSQTDGNKLLMRAGADFIKITPSGNFLITVTPATTTTELSAKLIKSDRYINPTTLSVVDAVISGNNLTINVGDKADYSSYVLVVYNTRYATSTESRDTSSLQYSVSVQDNTPAISLSSPAGGENWYTDFTKNITWSSVSVDNVTLEYSTNNGSNWTTIIASTPASAASYAWTIPAVASTQCQIRISDLAGNAPAAVSPAFTISPAPDIVLTAPDGGETWVVGSSQNITWVSKSTVANVVLDYSTDGGANWNSIVSSATASAGTYAWTVPNTVSANCKVRVSDAANSATNSVSAKAFSIAEAKVIVLSEDFSKITTGTTTQPGGTDLSSTLDTYTQLSGWTGSKIYAAGGIAKLGSSSGQGYIVTPAIDLSKNSGNGTIKFDVQTWNTDAKAIQVFLAADGTTFSQIGADIPTTSTMTTQTVAYTGGTSTSKIKISAKAASSNRYFLDNIVVTSGGTTAVEPITTKNIPSGFALEQNYPNPFNPATKIQFAVSKADHIALEVYNIQGEMIAALVNEYLPAGNYSAVFNASSLPSGTYFYRLTSSTSSLAKKMMLLK
jgi:hypothetical protein